jgi:hypothetical protein
LAVRCKTFIKKYTKAVNDGCAAVFAGAGLSVPSGYVSWKELLRPLAEEIGLSIDKEHDYLAISQYYYNKHGNRAGINDTVLDAFAKDAKNNDSVNIITRLPINTYWTTNYDHLIEEALKNNGRKPDVKIINENLTTNIRDCSAEVYKMHGDVQFPNDAVLIKEDYETYRINREPFTTILKGHLLSKVFLFIGFSFEDPNLNSILSWIKNLLGSNVREHYCLFEEVSAKEREEQEDFLYRKAKQDLIIEDLKRYGIQAVLLKSYSEIPVILKEIERQCNLKNIFIAGSMSLDNEKWTIDAAKLFSSRLAQELVAEGNHISSGYGLEIGSSIITGVLNEVRQKKYAHFDEYLKLYPFPQPSEGDDLKRLWDEYRNEMIKDCGVAIFIFGNKEDWKGSKINADGMIDEYEIAKKQDTILIPIASTGDIALIIYELMYETKEEYPYLADFWDVLRNETDVSKLVKVIQSIVNKTM